MKMLGLSALCRSRKPCISATVNKSSMPLDWMRISVMRGSCRGEKLSYGFAIELHQGKLIASRQISHHRTFVTRHLDLQHIVLELVLCEC